MKPSFDNAATIISQVPRRSRSKPFLFAASITLAVIAGRLTHPASPPPAEAHQPLVEVPQPSRKIEPAKAVETVRNEQVPAALPADLVALARKKRWLEALSAIDQSKDEANRSAWRQEIRDRWKQDLKGRHKNIDLLEQYLARWPDDNAVKQAHARAEEQHAAAAADLLKLLAHHGVSAELHASRKKRQYTLAGTWRMGQDAKLALIADPRLGTIGMLAELLARVGVTANGSSIQVISAKIQIEETKLEVSFPIACAKKMARVGKDGSDEALDTLRCVSITKH